MTVNWHSAEVEKAIRAAAARGVLKGTESVRNEVLRLIMRTRKTGRIYRVRGVRRRASAPGEAPANQTGRLVGSLRTTYQDGGLTGIVSASTKYAFFLEFGTRKMAARPFMRPALANMRKTVEQGIIAEVRKAVRRTR